MLLGSELLFRSSCGAYYLSESNRVIHSTFIGIALYKCAIELDFDTDGPLNLHKQIGIKYTERLREEASMPLSCSVTPLHTVCMP